MLIVDTSAIIPFVLADEAGDQCETVARALEGATCLVPALWRWEMANALWKALRIGRITQADLAGTLEDIEAFAIVIEPEAVGKALGETLILARRHDLTAYDATYLELALRLGAELATHDKDLRKAAIAEGVTIHPAL